MPMKSEATPKNLLPKASGEDFKKSVSGQRTGVKPWQSNWELLVIPALLILMIWLGGCTGSPLLQQIIEAESIQIPHSPDSVTNPNGKAVRAAYEEMINCVDRGVADNCSQCCPGKACGRYPPDPAKVWCYTQ